MPRLGTVAAHFAARFWDKTKNALTPFSVEAGHPIFLLGIEYKYSDTEDSTAKFLEDFQSRIFLPYRKGFESIAIHEDTNRGSLVTDKGWGCTIRSTQMMMAQSLVSILLGRDFRSSSATDEQIDIFRGIVWRFVDIPAAKLSLHRFVTYGKNKLNKTPGSWFSPRGAALAVRDLWSHSKQIGVLFFEGDSVVPETITNKLGEVRDGLILLVSLRLGLHSIELPTYNELVRLFKLPMFQGMVGADGREAYYIPAVSDEFVYYLDPHVVYPALNEVTPLEETILSMAAPNRMPRERLSPDISVAFTVKSKAEADKLLAFMRKSKLFSLEEARVPFQEPDLSGSVHDDDLFAAPSDFPDLDSLQTVDPNSPMNLAADLLSMEAESDFPDLESLQTVDPNSPMNLAELLSMEAEAPLEDNELLQSTIATWEGSEVFSGKIIENHFV